MSIFEQNWLHIRHVENERILCLNAYTVIISATLYALTNIDKLKAYEPYVLFFLWVFSVINLLLALKIEAVIEEYTKKNKEIVKRLGMEEFAGLRIKSGIWKFIRLKYIFPSIYGIMTFFFLVLLLRCK